jgi:hypothetical protein
MESESSNLHWLAAVVCLVGALAWVWMGAPLPDIPWLSAGASGPSLGNLDVALPDIELGLPAEPGFLPAAEAATETPRGRDTPRDFLDAASGPELASAASAPDALPFWSADRDAPSSATGGAPFKRVSVQSAVGRIDRRPGNEAEHQGPSAASPTTSNFAKLEQRCWDLGAVKMQLRATGGKERLYFFRCEVPLPGNDRMLRYFESTDRTPEAAMEKVLAYAENWQVRQARAAKAKAAKTRTASRSKRP